MVSDPLSLLDWKWRVFALYGGGPRIRGPEPRCGCAGARSATTCSRVIRSRRSRPTPEPASPGFPSSTTTRPPGSSPRSSRPSHAPTRSPPAATAPTRSPGSGSLRFELAEGAGARALLARGLRRRDLPPVPRRDQRYETYGAGRYLLDTVKGADLGISDGRLVLDFNFAYNPSCSYDPHGSARSPPRRTGWRCRSRPASATQRAESLTGLPSFACEREACRASTCAWYSANRGTLKSM